MDRQTKICTKCNQEKEVNFFYDQKNGRNGKRASCRECDYNKSKFYRYSNSDLLTEEEKETKRKYARTWYHKNKKLKNLSVMTPEQAKIRKAYLHRCWVEENLTSVKKINAKYRKNDKNLNAKISLCRGLGIKYKDIKNYPELIELKRLQLEALHKSENLIKQEKNGSQRIA